MAWMPLCTLLYIFQCAVQVFPQGVYRHLIPEPIPLPPDAPPAVYGDPLYLTPFIKAGNIEEARNLSAVGELPNAPSVRSYSGFFTVNELFDSNIFFWFFPALNNDKRAPVILWLQGGPGVSGLFGLFTEHGPYVINKNITASIRKYNWALTYNIIYVDSPVGTGFSFTNNEDGYARNESQVAKDLYEFLQQFFTVFYEYRKNEFYAAGESYGGKYVPAIAYKIHTEGAASRINLKGIAIGNGMCDPETMMNYADYLYQLGLVDDNQATLMRNLSDEIVEKIREEDYFGALVGMDKLIIDFNVLHYVSYFKNFTGLHFYYNLLYASAPDDYRYYHSYIVLSGFRKAVHVGNLTYNDGSKAQNPMLLDIMKSVKPWIAVLMDNYKVMFFNGQLDLIIPYPLTRNFLSTIDWKYAKEYKKSKREIWKLSPNDTEIAGYVHHVKDFYEVLVRNSGHILPHDQPKVALDLITRFISGKPFA